MDIELDPNQQTSLMQSDFQPFNLKISMLSTVELKEAKLIFIILGQKISNLTTLNQEFTTDLNLKMRPNTPFMLINASNAKITISSTIDFEDLNHIYNSSFNTDISKEEIDPMEFLNEHPVPMGYVDHLTSYYSVEFIFDSFRYIYLRPGFNLGLHTHNLTKLSWEILEGHPVIIVGEKVEYNPPFRKKFAILPGVIHDVINPSTTEWVLIKAIFSDEYDGTDVQKLVNL